MLFQCTEVGPGGQYELHQTGQATARHSGGESQDHCHYQVTTVTTKLILNY